MSRLAKFWLIFIVGVGAAVTIGVAYGFWLEYMCTLAAFSLIAAIIGATTADKVRVAGDWTAGIGIAVAVVFGLIFANWGVFGANFIAAIVWGGVNVVEVPEKGGY